MTTFNARLPHKTIEHPDFGRRYVQDGMLFFMDGSPMHLAESHRVQRAKPRAVERPPAAGEETAKPPESDLKTAMEGGFFKLKAFMRRSFQVDPRTKDEAMTWLRENGKLDEAA